MRKTYFTRKTLIALSLAFLYSFLFLFVGYCLTANKNMIQSLAVDVFGYVKVSGNGMKFLFVFLLLVALYIVVGAAAILYERRYAIVNGKKHYSFKMILIYILTALACFVLSFGVATLIDRIANVDVKEAYRFIGMTLLVTTIIYVLLAGVVAGVLLFIFNLILVDKPFKFFKEEDLPVIEDELEQEDVDVTSNFDSTGASSMGAAEGMLADSSVRTVTALDDREKVFPALSTMDSEYDGYAVEEMETDDVSLEELCQNFRAYLAQTEKLYYSIDAIRYFISGLATSHFMILEGLSGTGKSSLPRYFARYVSANLLFVPVQATWRDKTSLIGYFNDFSKTYTETEFLLGLYHGNYNPDMIHIYVLDEMNISRIEYYFADFLSVLEYPKDEWKLKIMQLPYGFIPPAKLMEGVLQIPENSFFIGTANKDDSTFTITDKVYDRAITIDFEERNEAFTVKGEYKPIKLSYSHLAKLFNEARSNKDNLMTDTDYEKLLAVTNFVSDEFDIIFGNRIAHQIEELIPVYVATGGKKEEAIDYLLSRKVLSKIEGRFEEFVKGALKELLELIRTTYGVGVLVKSEKEIQSMIKRL